MPSIKLLSILLVVFVVFFAQVHLAKASVVVEIIKDIIEAVIPIIITVALIVAVVVGGALVAGAVAQTLLVAAPTIAATLAGTILLTAVWVGSSLLLADCVFNGSSVDPNWICTDRSGGGGAVNLTVDVRVNNSDGPVSFTAPAAFNVQWAISGSDASTACSATGSWEGTIKESSGQAEFQNIPAGDYNYGLTCDKGGTIVYDSVVVDVIGPIVNLSSLPIVEIPDPLAVNWQTKNVISCLADSNPNVWSGSKSLSGSETIFPVTDVSKRGIYNFFLTCSDNLGKTGNSSSTSRIVQVPRCSFAANPSSVVIPFTSSVLSWQCLYADSCSIDQGIGSVDPVSGTKAVNEDQTTTFTLSCGGLDGLRSWPATIDVQTVSKPLRREVPPY